MAVVQALAKNCRTTLDIRIHFRVSCDGKEQNNTKNTFAIKHCFTYSAVRLHGDVLSGAHEHSNRYIYEPGNRPSRSYICA